MNSFVKSHALDVLLIMAAWSTNLSGAPKPSPIGTGPQHLTFTERSPHSHIVQMALREPFKDFARGSDLREYDLTNESFEAFVPPAYKPTIPQGLFVFISAGDAALTPGWGDVLARHKLIYISANNTGNGRDAPIRMGLALDAVANMKKLYNIDDRRVYLAGFSGGASAASWLISGFTDVLSGGIFMGGGDFYTLRLDENRRMIATTIGPPPGGDFAAIRKDLRLVLLTGENDPNARPILRAAYEGLVLDGFERVTLLEMPRVGHAHPSPQWLEKCILALERAKPNVVPATGPATQPRPGPAQVFQAKRILITAQYELARERMTSARRYLQQVADDYSATPSAAKAREMLKKLDSPTTKPSR